MKCKLIASLTLSGFLAFGALAQTLTAQEMIDQLKVKAQAAAQASTDSAVGASSLPRSRSLTGARNLTVDKATPQEIAVAPPPSLSLQIQFDFDSARIKPESQQSLANLAVAMMSSELLEAKFVIEGHTDAKGKADYNQRLSQQRADAVRLFLISKQVDGVRLQATGKGASDPANADDPLAAENRRVRVVNLQ